MANKRYEQCLSAMYGLRRFGIKLGLESITAVLAYLGKPQDDYRIIHIAGTNGKGSVAAMLSTILHAAGYRVGCYTSPHLEHFNERICINNQAIGNDEIMSAYEKVQQAPQPERGLTFFEFTTAMALYTFSRRKVDWAVIETGMGGRLDATNAVCPQLTIITNISLEHKSYLGTTLAAIAGEKAGIIKANTPLITGVSQPSARKVILQQAAERRAPAYLKGRDFRCRRLGEKRLSYFGMHHTLRNITLGLSGRHQIDNAALALAACETLSQSGKAELSSDTIAKGLKLTKWPGRLEVASERPYVILDGAHNLMAARKLAQYLKDEFRGKKITLVVGVLDDKPCDSILRDLTALCQKVVVTQPVIDRAIPANDLAKVAKKFSKRVDIIPDVAMAVDSVLKSSEDDDVVCVAGSLYVVGEAKTALKKLALRT
ncbi:MAG: folylpolyglutamate synthase/dihydrofolate synthase family protein [Desulfobacteraceae bacterium]